MTSSHSRHRNGFAGGMLLVLVMAVLLVVVMVVAMGQDPAPPPPVSGARPADVRTEAPETGAEAPPTYLPDWVPLAPGPEASEDAGTPITPAAETPTSNRPVTPAPQPTSARPYVFTAVAGDGCAGTATAGGSAVFPAGSPLVSMAGGWKGAGCAHGTFWSVPMSGDADRADSGTYVRWWFNTGTLTKGTCTVWVFVPKPARDLDAAGKPTFYQVTRSREDASVIGTFTIDQGAHRGTWVRAGSYPLDGGRLAIKLLNRGAGTGGARHGAGQVQVGCTS